LGFKVTNLFGNIMNEKLAGETALRRQYDIAGDSSLGYTIIRPGGLTDGPAEGPAFMEINQGDMFAGEVSRADVAQAAVASMTSQRTPSRAVFEIYAASSRSPLEGKFKQLVSGYERRGSSYDQMFEGLSGTYVTGPKQ
jgi:hypothetical protein